MKLRPARAIEALRQLIEEAQSRDVLAGDQAFTAWQKKVRGVVAGALGTDDSLVSDLDNVSYGLIMFSFDTSQHEWDRARAGGIREAVGLIEAAIYRLELESGGDDVVDDSSFDPELWAHVANLVADQDWPKVAAETAIYVEDRLKRWSGAPTGKSGAALYGQALYAEVLGKTGAFQLGGRSGEADGWLMLGMGFAKALGNVDRHNIQDREDIRRYAIGVLGVASLLLTQLKYEHPELAEGAGVPVKK